MALEKLRASLVNCPVVRYGEYDYFVHPITDGVPPGDPELLEEVADEIARVGNWDCDYIVSAESMGFPLAAAVSLRVRKPYLFLRKRRYGLPGEVSVAQTTGYGGADLFVNALRKGDRITFVDDVVSTGGTLRAVAMAMRELGVTLVDVIVVFEKTRDKAGLERQIGLPIKTLLGVDVVGGKAVERP